MYAQTVVGIPAIWNKHQGDGRLTAYQEGGNIGIHMYTVQCFAAPNRFMGKLVLMAYMFVVGGNAMPLQLYLVLPLEVIFLSNRRMVWSI